MSSVIIDGTPYAPSTPRIGVAITTRNRPDVYAQTRAAWLQHLPPGAVLVTVDDASDKPIPDADYRFNERAGIARAKNKCLELLDNAGCEHLFLTDDDTYPTSPDWWKPYVTSPEPHLMYTFGYKSGPAPFAHDGQHTAWPHPCGCLLYAHRAVLDRVGGMDPAYGMWGHEHVDWSNRIHNAGLTTWRFGDVTGSDQLLHCLDQDGVPRTVARTERDTELARNTAYYATQRHSSAYHEYRQTRNVVITTWLHAPDRQRGGKTSPTTSAEAAHTLTRSITGADVVLYADDGTGTHPATDLGIDVYHARWFHAWRYLRDNPDIQWAWNVDTTDVVMLHEPWPHMQPGRLYIGWENTLVGNDWMRANHPSTRMTGFINDHAHRMLLNCGIVGGDRATLQAFTHDMVALIQDNATDRWRGDDPHPLGTDMAPANYLAYTRWADRIETGPQVTTLFKGSETRNPHAWWCHK